MKERGWGRIINVLNTMAKSPRGGSAPTSVSRAAGMALTKVMAGEGAPHGILVNALLVGLIESDQWVRRHAATAPEKTFAEFTAGLSGDVPLGRFGKAEEFANLASSSPPTPPPTWRGPRSTSMAGAPRSSEAGRGALITASQEPPFARTAFTAAVQASSTSVPGLPRRSRLAAQSRRTVSKTSSRRCVSGASKVNSRPPPP